MGQGKVEVSGARDLSGNSGQAPAPDHLIAPPPSNTGVQTTKVLIDALSFTLQGQNPYKDADTLLGHSGWQLMPYGKLGYRACEKKGSLFKYYDGREGMGVHVSGMGQACRELEAWNARFGWSSFFFEILKCHGQFSRLDVAVDAYNNELDINRIASDVRHGFYSGHYKGARIIEGINLESGASQGMTIYLGSPSSDTMVRIYDKAKEQGVDYPWVRVEMEFKRKQAQNIAQLIAHNEDNLHYLEEVLYGLVDFKEPNLDDSVKNRWPTAKYWSDFLLFCRKEKISIRPEQKVCEDVEKWLKDKISPSIAMIVEANGGDLSIIDDILRRGQAGLKSKHKSMIEEALIRKGIMQLENT